MSPIQTTILVVLIAIAAVAALSAMRIVQQYERGVVFRLGPGTAPAAPA